MAALHLNNLNIKPQTKCFWHKENLLFHLMSFHVKYKRRQCVIYAEKLFIFHIKILTVENQHARPPQRYHNPDPMLTKSWPVRVTESVLIDCNCLTIFQSYAFYLVLLYSPIPKAGKLPKRSIILMRNNLSLQYPQTLNVKR